MELPSSTRIIQLPNELIIQEVATCLRKGQTATIRIKGNSMFPFLRHEKDAVRLQSIHPDQLRCGQIVFFKYGPFISYTGLSVSKPHSSIYAVTIESDFHLKL